MTLRIESQPLAVVGEYSPSAMSSAMPVWADHPLPYRRIVRENMIHQMSGGVAHSSRDAGAAYDAALAGERNKQALLPGDVRMLPENVQRVYQPSVPAGAKQAPFGGTAGYFGPCSPNSVNTYEFTIYAMPTATLAGLTQQSTLAQAAAAITGAALASAKLAGES